MDKTYETDVYHILYRVISTYMDDYVLGDEKDVKTVLNSFCKTNNIYITAGERVLEPIIKDVIEDGK